MAQPFITDNANAAFEHFRSIVAGHSTDIRPLSVDADLVRFNAAKIAAALEPHWQFILEQMPTFSVNEIKELPTLALALVVASERIVTPASKKEIAARQKRMRPLRRLMLAQLEVFAALGLVDRDVVAQIRSGSGPLDQAKDGVSIPAVFRQAGANIEGKHAFTAEQLKQLEDDGNWLLQQLRPMGSVRDDVERSPEAILRDQLWAEMNRRFDEAYKAGVVIWGRREVDARLPMLGSRQATTTKPDGDDVDSEDPTEPIAPTG